MKIIIDRRGESQTPVITIDMDKIHYPYAIRNTFELALELEGFGQETINEVFGIMPATVCGESND